MYQKSKLLPLVLFLLSVASDALSSSDSDKSDSNETICFRINDAAEPDALTDDIKSVDGSRFYSFLAKIGWTSTIGEVSFHCGGTLISEKIVLTAAHCVDHDRPQLKRQPDLVRIAEQALDGHGIGEDIQIASIFSHTLYGALSMYDDIAIIKLKEPSKYRPACIWIGAALPTTSIFALGHNMKRIGAQLTMSLKFLSNDECDRLYSPSRKLPNGITGSQVCAGNSNITDADDCKGFIGAPLLTQTSENTEDVFVVGFTNYCRRCASDYYPSIYTRMSFYKIWIDEAINDKYILLESE